MTMHWDFFKESDSSFGKFYPKNYIVAGYGSHGRADEVRQQFLDAGFAQDDVASAPGQFVIDTLQSEEGKGWMERFQKQIAEVVGTEDGYMEDDLKLARHGGAFVFVYVPKDADLERARPVLESSGPVFARRYLALGIERLIYPQQSQINAQAYDAAADEARRENG